MLRAATDAVAAIDMILLSALKDGVLGDDVAEIEDIRSGSCCTSTTRRVRSGTPSIATKPPWLARRSSLSTASKHCRGGICSSGCSAANASATTRWVVP
jgi:hypothetical protein